MPETIANEVPTPPKKRNERTEAKFFEDADKLIAEAQRLGADYDPSNDIAKLVNLTAKLDAYRQANTDVIQAESASNTSGELLDQLTYTDANSLMNGCISGKSYIKSKYKSTGEPYKNIAKTRFSLPSRLRK